MSGRGASSEDLILRLRRGPRILRTSDRLVLCALTPGDAFDYFASIDDEVKRWQGYAFDVNIAALDGRSRKRLEASIREMCSSRFDGWPTQLAVRDASTREFCGSYALLNIGPGGTSAELGWWLAASARGRGLGHESLLLALAYAHEDVRIRRVIMGTTADNTRANAQITRSGAALKKEQQDHRLPNGVTVPVRWYEHSAN